MDGTPPSIILTTMTVLGRIFYLESTFFYTIFLGNVPFLRYYPFFPLTSMGERWECGVLGGGEHGFR